MTRWQENATMDTANFDGITRNLGSTVNRRSALRGLVAGAAAAAVGSALLRADDASAKRRGKKGNKSNGTCRLIHCKPGFRCRKGKCRPHGKPATAAGLPEGSPCASDGQCRSSEHQICEIPFGAGNSDKACCRGEGATCGPDLHCCTGEAGGREFQCVLGTCQLSAEVSI
jgi:hypothetical protein